MNNSWKKSISERAIIGFDHVVVVVTLFPTKIHENTHMYNTLTVVSPQNVRMYFVSGCQKKLRLIELAAATCYLQFCRATARTGPEEMTHWHPGGRFKESFSSNGYHNIYLGLRPRFLSTESQGSCFSHDTGYHDRILLDMSEMIQGTDFMLLHIFLLSTILKNVLKAFIGISLLPLICIKFQKPSKQLKTFRLK